MPIIGSFDTYLPEVFKVNRPRKTIIPRGPYGSTAPATSVTFRIHESEWETVNEARLTLGMSKSQFIRWCVLEFSNDILEHHRNYHKQK